MDVVVEALIKELLLVLVLLLLVEVVVVASLRVYSVKFVLSLVIQPNFCHFRSDVSYQPHESLCFIDPATRQDIPYSAGSYKTSNTWINPNNKSGHNTEPSAMLIKSNTSWIPDSGASLHVIGDVNLRK